MNESLLVFGDDRSAEADVAWLWINCQRWPGWRVEVVEARLPEGAPIVPAERSDAHAWEPDAPRLLFAEAELASCTHLLAEADPRLALCRPADLTVIGPRGAGLLKSLHLGSTAEWLLAHPPSPLLIARHGRQVQRVIVATDGSPHARRAVETAAALPWIGDVAVTVVAVDDERTDAERAVADAGAVLADRVGVLKPIVLHGRPTHELLALVDRQAADLVVLGTRGLTGLSRLRLGSTAGAVARSAPCSVLVACEPEE